MNNQHNPIARIIEDLQYRWFDATKKKPDHKIIRWSVKPEEVVLFDGFYKLESSAYGRLPEFFVVLLTPFRQYENHSRELIKDWINMWEQDKTVNNTGCVWDTTERYKKEAETTSDPNQLLIEMLKDFRETFCKPEQNLVFAMIPKEVKDFSAYNVWILNMTDELPDNIKLSFIDHIGKNHFKTSFSELKDKSITIECDDLNLQKTIRHMATSGDVNQPDVGFRKCLYEMSDGVAAKDAKHIDKWGMKIIEIGAKSGSKSLLATAYLVYAGNLMQLKKDKAEELLDKGVMIAENAYKTGDKDVAWVLLQLYGYKSANESIHNNKTKACRMLFKQLQFAMENDMNIYAISLGRVCARTAKKVWEDEIYRESLKLGYAASEKLSDEELRASEISVIAFYYMKVLREDGNNDEASNIDERMKMLLGDEWKEEVPSISDKQAQTIPDIRETVDSMNIKN